MIKTDSSLQNILREYVIFLRCYYISQVFKIFRFGICIFFPCVTYNSCLTDLKFQNMELYLNLTTLPKVYRKQRFFKAKLRFQCRSSPLRKVYNQNCVMQSFPASRWKKEREEGIMWERGNTEEVLLWTAVWTLLAVGTGRWPKLGWEKSLCKD